jgi:replicative DNA helicase
MNSSNPLDILFTPQEIYNAGTRYLEERRRNKDTGIPIGLASLDEDFLPLLPGEVVSVIGRPGNGKTGFMMRWARWRAEQLRQKGETNRVVVYATWEQHVEDLHAFHVAAEAHLNVTDMARGRLNDQDWERVIEVGARRVELPLWFMGHSAERRKRRPHMTVDNVALALDAIEKWNEDKTQIDMVFIDYLQRIRFNAEKVESKTIAISEIFDRLKDGALAFGCPFVVGVQATRDVDSRAEPIPQMEDGQWTSNIEQTSDRVLSVVRPRRYRDEGETFGSVIVRGHCQMLVCILKQKMGIDNRAHWVYFDPAYNRLDELEIRQLEIE